MNDLREFRGHDKESIWGLPIKMYLHKSFPRFLESGRVPPRKGAVGAVFLPMLLWIFQSSKRFRLHKLAFHILGSIICFLTISSLAVKSVTCRAIRLSGKFSGFSLLFFH